MSAATRGERFARRGRAIVVIAMLALGAVAANAADVETVLPIVYAMPGASVQVPIDITPDLSGLQVQSIQYHMPIDPAIVSSVILSGTGLVWNWGTPFTNVTATSVDVAAFGVTPISSTATRLHSLQLTVAPGATIGSTMVLSLTTLKLNEGTPSIHQVLGKLRVGTASTGVGERSPAALELGPALPNPARATTRIGFVLPAEGSHALTIFGLDGRRIRRLSEGSAGAGAHEVVWDVRDGAGRRVAPGIYFAVLEAGGLRRSRRIAVVE